jgi:hypothetical protein
MSVDDPKVGREPDPACGEALGHSGGGRRGPVRGSGLEHDEVGPGILRAGLTQRVEGRRPVLADPGVGVAAVVEDKERTGGIDCRGGDPIGVQRISRGREPDNPSGIALGEQDSSELRDRDRRLLRQEGRSAVRSRDIGPHRIGCQENDQAADEYGQAACTASEQGRALGQQRQGDPQHNSPEGNGIDELPEEVVVGPEGTDERRDDNREPSDDDREGSTHS